MGMTPMLKEIQMFFVILNKFPFTKAAAMLPVFIGLFSRFQSSLNQ